MLNTPSKTYYCVYWYPTIFHQEKEHRTIQPHLIDISDKSTGNQYYLTIEEERDQHKIDAINLHYYLSKYPQNLDELKSDKDCISFVFHYIRHSRNGFVVYSYERDTIVQSFWSLFGDQKAKAIKESISSTLMKQNNRKPTNYEIENYPIDRILLSCYHHSKNFYHKHEVQEEADGKLEAYYFTLDDNNKKRHYLTNEPTLYPKNHNVINWYVDQFEKQFNRYAKRVSETYRFCTEQLKHYDTIIANSEKFYNEQNKHKIDDVLLLLKWECYIYEQSDFNVLINRQFREKFKSDCLSKLQNVNIKDEKKEMYELFERIKEFKIEYLRKRLKILETICGNATTEYTYCKTLIESKYNEMYDYTMPISNEEIATLIDYYEKKCHCDEKLLKKDQCRKKAFNIRNCIRYIEGIRQKCNIWENELSQALIDKVKTISERVEDISESNQSILKASQKSSRLSELLAWISLTLGLWGLGFALKDTPLVWMSYNYKLFKPLILLGIALLVLGIIRLIIDVCKNKKE